MSVFDIMSPDWASSDLNLRFYLYAPGSPQDPTWNLDRYIDPDAPRPRLHPLKPGRPDLVTFSRIAGSLELPTRTGEPPVRWDTLLGTSGPTVRTATRR